MRTLVIAEHDHTALKPAVLNTITAAQRIGGEIDILVAGHNCTEAAKSAAQIAGVKKVLVADGVQYAHPLAENIAALIVSIAKAYSHVLAPATSFGKNVMPRVAALLDVAQVSDIVKVETPDTFVRPIYAGNALATVQSGDAVKVITVRSTGFDAAAATASIGALPPVATAGAKAVPRTVMILTLSFDCIVASALPA